MRRDRADSDEVILVIFPAVTANLADWKAGPIENTISMWFDCFDALTYLHNKRIMHRDIKAANIGVSHSRGKLSAIILDLGNAVNDLQSNDHEVGTLPFLAPEVWALKLHDKNRLSGKLANYNEAIDVWGLALSFIEHLVAPIALNNPADEPPGQTRSAWHHKNELITSIACEKIHQKGYEFMKAQLRDASQWNASQRPHASTVRDMTARWLHSQSKRSADALEEGC